MVGCGYVGFYHWETRPQSATSARGWALIARVQHFFDESDGTYDYSFVLPPE